MLSGWENNFHSSDEQTSLCHTPTPSYGPRSQSWLLFRIVLALQAVKSTDLAKAWPCSLQSRPLGHPFPIGDAPPKKKACCGALPIQLTEPAAQSLRG